MAKSKSEHIDIRVSKPVQDKPAKGQSSTKPEEKQTPEEESVEKDGGFTRAMHTPGQTVKPEFTQTTEEEATEDKDVNTPEATTTDSTESTLEQPSAAVAESRKQDVKKDQKPKNKTSNKTSLKDDEKDAHKETSKNEKTDVYDNFYSSKLDTSQEEPQKPPKANLDHSSTSKHAIVSVRFWFIFLIFVITVLAGFVMLYQLEQAQTGSGIIFEWL